MKSHREFHSHAGHPGAGSSSDKRAANFPRSPAIPPALSARNAGFESAFHNQFAVSAILKRISLRVPNTRGHIMMGRNTSGRTYDPGRFKNFFGTTPMIENSILPFRRNTPPDHRAIAGKLAPPKIPFPNMTTALRPGTRSSSDWKSLPSAGWHAHYMEQIPAYQDAPFSFGSSPRPLGETQTPHIGKAASPSKLLLPIAVIQIVAVGERPLEIADELGKDS